MVGVYQGQLTTHLSTFHYFSLRFWSAAKGVLLELLIVLTAVQ